MIWNDQSNGLVHQFETEEQALEFVRARIARSGPKRVADWSLLHFTGDENDQVDDLGTGEHLAERARAAVGSVAGQVA